MPLQKHMLMVNAEVLLLDIFKELNICTCKQKTFQHKKAVSLNAGPCLTEKKILSLFPPVITTHCKILE